MTYKPDWADRIASSTTNLRKKNSWEYEHPTCAWESMPWFVRWPLAFLATLYFGGALLMPILIMLK